MVHKCYFDLHFPPLPSLDLRTSYSPLDHFRPAIVLFRLFHHLLASIASGSLHCLPGNSSPDMDNLFFDFTEIFSEMSPTQRVLPQHPMLKTILPSLFIPFPFPALFFCIFLHIRYLLAYCLSSVECKFQESRHFRFCITCD